MALSGVDKLKQVLQIQELFHGRFSQLEATCLLEKQNWDIFEAIEFIFNSDPSEVRQHIGATLNIGLELNVCPICHNGAVDYFPVMHCLRLKHKQYDLEERIQNGTDLAEEWSEVGADHRHISKSVRQFACLSCDKTWWKKVPRRKMVSKCFRCKKRYEALERVEEWGWAEFRCTCGNVFGGFCQRITSSPCRNCQSDVFPSKIIPPTARQTPRRVIACTDIHFCNAPDCLARQGGPYLNRRRRRAGTQTANISPDHSQGETKQTCVHPRYRDGHFKSVVVAPSSHHVSSGSTIDTCLTQEDLSDLVSVSDGIHSYQERSGPLGTVHEDKSEHSSGDEADQRNLFDCA